MTDWQSPVEQAHDADAFGKLIHAMLGLYIWEFVTSLDFDWAIITGRKFRWPMVFYFLGRYILLGALIGVAISLDVTEEVNCQALYTFNQCAGNFAIGLASVNLSIRTMGIWRLKWYIVVPLAVIILGHWSLLLHGVLLKAQWVNGQGCVITQTNNTILSASFIYSMGLDLLVLVLTAYKLSKPEGSKSKLVQLIFNDGLVYFVVAFLANMLATIFMLLNLNAIMSIAANVPAAVASTIVASRVVRRLSNFHIASAEMFESSRGAQGSYQGYRPTGSATADMHRTHTRSTVPNIAIANKHQNMVHVQMETFSSSDNNPGDYTSKTPTKPRREELGTDLEAQRRSSEFKHLPY